MKYIVSSPPSVGSALGMGLARGVYYILGIIEMLLAFRFVFKIFGANPTSPFVAWIYDVSHIFLVPFSNIFPRITLRNDTIVSVFEPETIIAILIYSILAKGFAHLIAILFRTEKAEVSNI